MPIKYLQPIKESTRDYEALEKALKLFFKEEIYLPCLRELGFSPSVLKNDARFPNALLAALHRGAISFSRGSFSGHFNAAISKELRALGARFDRKTSTFRLPHHELPIDVRNAVSASEARFRDKLERIDGRLRRVLGDKIGERFNSDQFFDKALWRVDGAFRKSVRAIAIEPELTKEQRARISAEWGKNMQLWIEDFTQKEIVELRQKIAGTVFKGNRYGSAIKTIQDSYGVSANKAKFLARQETQLLMTKYKQTRYQKAGVEHYVWVCVSGSGKHPVRPLHKKNDNKVFRWSDPPIVDESGARKNPGQDYNCRCTARPLVGYSGPTGIKAPR
jgi:SPP1 gp7 family putative phage head morphogenesis protein